MSEHIVGALTERLREMSKRGHWPLLGYEAADEIDELRAQVAALTDENEHLRASVANSGGARQALEGESEP